MMAQYSPNLSAPGVVHSALVLPPDLAERFKQVNGEGAWADFRRDLLEPLVQGQIIEVRFREADRQWTNYIPNILRQIDDVLPLVQDCLARGTNHHGITRGARLAPGDIVAKYAAITNALEQARRSVRAYSITPPADAEWWTTVSGKEAVAFGIARDAADRLTGSQTAAGIVGQWMKDVALEAAWRTKLQEAIQEELDDLEKKFQEQKAHLETLSQATAFLPLDLDMLVSRFPLVLGLMFAISILWPSYRRGGLMQAAKLLPRDQPTSDRIWSYAQPPTANNVAFLVMGIGFFLWIAVAAGTAVSNGLVSSREALGSGGVGALAVAAALAYRFARLRSLNEEPMSPTQNGTMA